MLLMPKTDPSARKGVAGMRENDEIFPGFSIEKFLAEQKDQRWTPETLRSYRKSLCDLLNFTTVHGAPTPSTLAAWRSQLQQHYGARSINLHLAAVNNYLRWCGRYDLLMRHDQVDETPTPVLTREEYLKLLRAARRSGKHRLYLLIKLFATTDLPLQCLDQVTAELVRAGGGTLDHRGTPRVWRLPAALRQELLDYLAEAGITRGAVFITRSGRPLNRSNLCREMQALCAEEHIPREKGNPRALRNLYHATRQTIYANLEQLLQQAYNQLLQAEQTAAGWKEGA